MTEPINIDDIKTYDFSLSELKELTGLPDAFLQEFLNLLRNIGVIIEFLNVEIIQRLEDVPTDFLDGSIPVVNGGFLVADLLGFNYNIATKTLQIGTIKSTIATNLVLLPTTGIVLVNAAYVPPTIENEISTKKYVDDNDIIEGGTENGQLAFWDTDGWKHTEKTELFWDDVNKRFGILKANPTAKLHLPAGTAVENTAPLKFSLGIQLAVAEAGAIEYITNLFKLRGGDGLQIGDDVNNTTISPSGNITMKGTADTIDTIDKDLLVDCGTEKTLKLIEPVWDDLQFPVSSAKVPAANAPTWETFTPNTNEYSFGINDFIDCHANEIPHGWVEGTNVDIHAHITTKAENSTGSDRFAQFTVWVAYVNKGEVWQQTSFTAELTIPDGTAALQIFYLDLGDLVLTNFLLGTEIKIRIGRVAATGGTEYPGNIFTTQVGLHNKHNTLGSRRENVK